MIVKKESLKRHFSKASRTYDDNASVQLYMGKKLLENIAADKFKHILEIGCGSGIFTEEIVKRYSPHSIALNDISEEMLNTCRKRFSDYTNISYHPGDIEKISLKGSYDLIASNACFQWLSDLKVALNGFIEALNSDGILAFTSFGNENVREISSLTNNGLRYLSYSEINEIIKSLDVPYSLHEEVIQFHYKDALEMLKTLKKTGVTGFSKKTWTRGMLNRFIEEYESKYSDEKGVFLTWHLYYAVIRKQA